MDKQQAFDRGILIPMFIGGFSVIGMVVVLLIGRSLNSPPEAPVTPSETRFQYQYLGTEPAITTPLPEETGTPATIAPTEEPVPTDGSVTPTQTAPPRPTFLATPTGGPPTNTPRPTVTSASLPALNPGVYDDVDSHLVYNGWYPTNSGGTLHVSTVPGSTIFFRFIGKQVRIIYQGGSTLGRMQISITGSSGNVQTETVDESSQNEWPSLTFPNGTYSVTITHLPGGGPVNIDQIIVREPPNTPTPTPTPTPRP